MGTLFCSSCGLEAALNVIGEPELAACEHCGNKTFVTQEWITWVAALTEYDRRLLKSYKIALS